MARIRTRYMDPIDGSFYQTPIGLTPAIEAFRSESYRHYSRIEDTFGLRNSYFKVDHVDCDGHRLTLRYLPDPNKPHEFKDLKNFPMRYFTDLASVPAHLTLSAKPPDTYLATQLLAATNPSKPVIDLPVSLVELKDIPGMLKKAGEDLMKKWANQTLSREFGWVPLYKDLQKLQSFSKWFKQRLDLFNSLQQKPQLRKATLWKGTNQNYTKTIVPSNSSPAYCTVNHERQMILTKTKVWGYVEWTPSADFNRLNDAYNPEAMKLLALNSVLGTHIGFATLWELTPWSWMADWFGNIGSWLEANRSSIPVTPSLPRICETTETTAYYTAASSNIGLKPGSTPITQRRITKSRRIASGSLPSAHVPLFTQRQVDILASLAILRMK